MYKSKFSFLIRLHLLHCQFFTIDSMWSHFNACVKRWQRGWFLKEKKCLISHCTDLPKKIEFLFQKRSWKNQLKKIKKQKNLQKPLHLEHYISTHDNKFHLQIVNILFIIKLQNNFEFNVSKFMQNIGDCNHRSNPIYRI